MDRSLGNYLYQRSTLWSYLLSPVQILLDLLGRTSPSQLFLKRCLISQLILKLTLSAKLFLNTFHPKSTPSRAAFSNSTFSTGSPFDKYPSKRVPNVEDHPAIPSETPVIVGLNQYVSNTKDHSTTLLMPMQIQHSIHRTLLFLKVLSLCSSTFSESKTCSTISLMPKISLRNFPQHLLLLTQIKMFLTPDIPLRFYSCQCRWSFDCKPKALPFRDPSQSSCHWRFQSRSRDYRFRNNSIGIRKW